VGRDKVQVSAATLAIRYNDMEVTVTEDQPLEVHHAEYSGNQNEIEQGPSIGIYKIGPAAFKLSAQKFGINIVTDASNSITIKVDSFRSFIISKSKPVSIAFILDRLQDSCKGK